MPGGDGTGPLGRGPRSGRGAGYCSGYHRPGYANPFPGRRFRRKNYGFPGSRYYWGGEADERAALQRRAEFMREQISAIEERLKEIGEPDARE